MRLLLAISIAMHIFFLIYGCYKLPFSCLQQMGSGRKTISLFGSLLTFYTLVPGKHSVIIVCHKNEKSIYMKRKCCF